MNDTSSRPGCICSAFSDSDPNCPVCHPKTVIRTSKEINDPLLVKALRDLLDRYVGLVNCGDCGNWDPEKEGEVAQARAALRLANVAPYMNSPIECGHRLARLVCPDCGIDLRGNVLNTSETCEPFRSRITIERVKELRLKNGAGPVRTIPGEGNFAFCCCCGARTKQVREFFGYNLCGKCDEASKPHALKANSVGPKCNCQGEECHGIAAASAHGHICRKEQW